MSEQPNILFIMADDHASKAISAYEYGINKTPNIDRIANEGIRLNHCYVTNSICTPSRAAILAGTYNHVNCVTTLNTPMNNKMPNVAKHLQTNHHEMFVSASDAQSLIPKLPLLYDEPFADSSQIPTHFVSIAAKKEVTVSLSGDAGDELFGGYNRYLWAPSLWKKIKWMPFQYRKLLASAITSCSISSWDKIGNAYNFLSNDNNNIIEIFIDSICYIFSK